MEKILIEENVGYLGLSVDSEPYVVPLNYAYFPGKIIMHCAHEGKKLAYLRENPNVCFTVGRQAGKIERHSKDLDCHLNSESVICYGRSRIIEDLPLRTRLLNEFNQYFRPGAEPIEPKYVKKCKIIEIQIDTMTGRKERVGEDLERTYWVYKFDD